PNVIPPSIITMRLLGSRNGFRKYIQIVAIQEEIMYKRLSFLLAMLLIVGLLVPFGVSAQGEAVLRYPISPDPEHLNPFTATTIAISVILNNIYEGLFSLNQETGQPEPALAESY